MRKKVIEKILDVDASMQGSLEFRDPVNLRINGTFEGSLNTKGSLTIGENASVRANITGEAIIVAGDVKGDIKAQKSLKIVPPARVIGNIQTPLLNIVEGATLEGYCQMLSGNKMAPQHGDYLSIDEVARYLDVDPMEVAKWVTNGRLPGIKDNEKWKFERSKIDEWVATEKIK